MKWIYAVVVGLALTTSGCSANPQTEHDDPAVGDEYAGGYDNYPGNARP